MWPDEKKEPNWWDAKYNYDAEVEKSDKDYDEIAKRLQKELEILASYSMGPEKLRKAFELGPEPEPETPAKEYPPYFMTIHEAIEFIKSEGYNVVSGLGANVTQKRIGIWDERIREANERLT